jgi:hypothetical protein
MEKEFVTYEQALTLKKLGFDEMCFGFYRNPIVELMRCRNSEPWMGNSVVSAPLKQQVLRWFREKYDLHFYSYQIKLYPDGDYPTKIWHGKINDEFVNTENGLAKSHFYSYKEAENACIDKLIEICKQQNND